MIVSLLLGAAVGWGAPRAEDHARRLMAQAFSVEEAAIQPVELRAVTLAAGLFLAALLCWLIAYPSAVALSLGLLIGVLLPRLQGRIRAARAPDYDS